MHSALGQSLLVMFGLLFLIANLSPRFGFSTFVSLVYGKPIRKLPVTPIILLFFLVQSAAMNYFTFVSGLPAYLILTFFLSVYDHFYVQMTGRKSDIERDNFASLLATVVMLSSHTTALFVTLYAIYYRLVYPLLRAIYMFA